MAIGSIGSSSLPFSAPPVQVAAKGPSLKLDKDGDYDNGAPEKGAASAPALPADPNRGRTLNITA